MYRPHEAREDTILFPEFKNLISQKEYDELGEIFEQKEHHLFGEDGFDKIIAEISKIEKKMMLLDGIRYPLKRLIDLSCIQCRLPLQSHPTHFKRITHATNIDQNEGNQTGWYLCTYQLPTRN